MAITEIMMTIIKTIRVALLMFMQLIDFLIMTLVISARKRNERQQPFR